MKIEEWKPIKGATGYSVSSLGRVRSEDRLAINRGLPMRVRERLLKASPGNHGYPVVNIKVNGVQRPHMVHRLVATAFLGDCPDGFECAHLDGCRGNPSLDNLKWVSHAENELHKHAHGTMAKAILTADQARYVLSAEKSGAALARELGVCPSTISAVRTKKTWAHICQ